MTMTTMTMTTMTRQSNRLSGLILAGLVLGLAGLLLAQAVGTLPALNHHAVERHGAQAGQAWQYINGLDHAEHCRWSCSDGRDRYACAMGDGQWAIAVVEAGQLVTSFVAGQDYAKSIVDRPGCTNPYHYSHP